MSNFSSEDIQEIKSQIAKGKIDIAFEIIEKTEQWYDKKNDKLKRRSAVSKNQLVRDRLKVLQHYNKLKFRYVLWDTWFTAAENLKFVHSSEDHFALFVFFTAEVAFDIKVAHITGSGS